MEGLQQSHSHVVLQDVVRTLLRLERVLSGQDDRLYEIELAIARSLASSPTSTTSTGKSTAAHSTAVWDSQDSVSTATTPSQLPASPHQPSSDLGSKLHNKFAFDDSDDNNEDALSVSVYTESSDTSPRPLAIGLEGESGEVADFQLPARSPLRPLSRCHIQSDVLVSDDAADLAGTAPVIVAVAYKDVESAVIPRRIEPVELCSSRTEVPSEAQEHVGSLGGMFICVRNPSTFKRSWRWKQKANARSEAKKKREVARAKSHEGHSFRRFWACVLLLFTSTHRSRPYIAA